jgi:hypothetical protein
MNTISVSQALQIAGRAGRYGTQYEKVSVTVRITSSYLLFPVGSGEPFLALLRIVLMSERRVGRTIMYIAHKTLWLGEILNCQVLPDVIMRQTKLHGLSLQANYTDRATAACRRSDCQLLRIEVPRGQHDGSLQTCSRFSRQEPLLFYEVAPQLYSRG